MKCIESHYCRGKSNKLLSSHFGANWRENQDLEFYINIIDGTSNVAIHVEDMCELVDRPNTI